jgi:hypothetical protein
MKWRQIEGSRGVRNEIFYIPFQIHGSRWIARFHSGPQKEDSDSDLARGESYSGGDRGERRISDSGDLSERTGKFRARKAEKYLFTTPCK